MVNGLRFMLHMNLTIVLIDIFCGVSEKRYGPFCVNECLQCLSEMQRSCEANVEF